MPPPEPYQGINPAGVFHSHTLEKHMKATTYISTVITMMLCLLAWPGDMRSPTEIRQERTQAEEGLRYSLRSHPEGAQQWNSNGHWYMLAPRAMTWQAAYNWCKSQGGHLVVINSDAELRYIVRMLGDNNAWLGASDSRREGNWCWVTGERVDLDDDNWWPGEPNNSGSGEDCMAMTPGLRNGEGKGRWVDRPGSDFRLFVCEWVE